MADDLDIGWRMRGMWGERLPHVGVLDFLLRCHVFFSYEIRK